MSNKERKKMTERWKQSKKKRRKTNRKIKERKIDRKKERKKLNLGRQQMETVRQVESKICLKREKKEKERQIFGP